MVSRENRNNAHAKLGGQKRVLYGIFRSGLLSTELRFVFQDIQVQYVALIVHDVGP